VRKFTTYSVNTFTGGYPQVIQMYLGRIFVQSVLEIRKLIISKLKTETRQLIKTIPGLYFSPKMFQLLVKLNSANDNTAAIITVYYHYCVLQFF